MAKFWLSTAQLSMLLYSPQKLRNKLAEWIMKKQNFGSQSKEEAEEARELISKAQTVQDTSEVEK